MSDLVAAALEAEGASGAVVVAFIEEQAMAVLNARYRGVDEPTDVLSFRSEEGEAGWPKSRTGPDLGEIVVCPSVVRRYAEEEDAVFGAQLGWTLIHGVLHLLGYDHEKDDGGMRRREQGLLVELVVAVRALDGR
ncbi:MAG: rRNA maturation RNase YbeY [Actinobacteria bacterium RBG_16_64_13]|nr:MAG: rRNA maturation RNase YbeY [Actinobacteria bacterium RBG_16_64_13]